MQIKTVLVKLGDCAMRLTSYIEGKQLDLCNLHIFCHVDCFCLQGEKEDEARSIFLFRISEATKNLSLVQTRKPKGMLHQGLKARKLYNFSILNLQWVNFAKFVFRWLNVIEMLQNCEFLIETGGLMAKICLDSWSMCLLLDPWW